MTLARSLTAVALAILLAAVAATPAGARLTRVASSFPATGAVSPAGVAVEQSTGDVYVVGNESGNVEKFTAKGVREASFASPHLEGPLGVAVDNSGGSSGGDVYVGTEEEIVKLDPTGKEAAGFTPITGIAPQGIAVDSSNGDLIVKNHFGERIEIFTSTGALISGFSASGTQGVAVGADGDIFTGGEAVGVQEWSASDGYSVPTEVASGRYDGVALDLLSGDVLAGEDEGYISEYQASHAPLLQFGSGLLRDYPFGVAVDEEKDTVYVTNPANGLVYVFGPPAELAEVITGTPATGVTGTVADVSGNVDPEGIAVTGCRFEYGLSAAYGSSAPCSQVPPLTGNTAVAVSGSLEGLQPDQTYHYRLAAVNVNGTNYGEDETFQTSALAPSLVSESVSALKQTAVRLDATINPNNQETTYHFEFGTTAAYGTSVPIPDANAGSGYGDVVVAQQLSDLTAGTTYHYRIVAINASSPAGGTVGADQTFTTPPVQPPIVSSAQASGTAQNSATLTGTIDTQGFETTYEFDIGTDTSYGTRIFGDAGREAGGQTFMAALQGLAAGTTYHYRIVATNVFGTSYGADQTFTTAAYPSSILTAPVAPALVPTALLVPAGSGVARAPVVKPVGHTARVHKRKTGRDAKRSRRERKGGSGHTGDIHATSKGRGRG